MTHIELCIEENFTDRIIEEILKINKLIRSSHTQVIIKQKLNDLDESGIAVIEKLFLKDNDIWIEFINDIKKENSPCNINKLCKICSEHDILYTLKNYPPCLLLEYEDVCEFQYHLNLQYDPENSSTIMIPMEVDGINRYEKCFKCKYKCVCSGMPENVNYNDDIVPYSINNVIDLEAYIQNQLEKQGFQKSDAVVLFSGGLDSKVSAALYATRHKDQQIVLLSFTSSKSLYQHRLQWAGKDIQKKVANVIGHYIVELPDNIYYDAIFNKSNMEMGKRLDSNISCSLCKCTMVMMASYICMFFFECKELIMGNNQVMANGKSHLPFPQCKEMLEIYNDISNECGIRLKHIIYDISKREDVVEAAKEFRIAASSGATSIGCPLAMPRTMKNGKKETLNYIKDYIVEIKKMARWE